MIWRTCAFFFFFLSKIETLVKNKNLWSEISSHGCVCVSELHQHTRTHFPKEYRTRNETFHKTNYSKWPLPSCPKHFRILWGLLSERFKNILFRSLLFPFESWQCRWRWIFIINCGINTQSDSHFLILMPVLMWCGFSSNRSFDMVEFCIGSLFTFVFPDLVALHTDNSLWWGSHTFVLFPWREIWNEVRLRGWGFIANWYLIFF